MRGWSRSRQEPSPCGWETSRVVPGLVDRADCTAGQGSWRLEGVFWSGGGRGDIQALWHEYRETRDRALRDRLILTYAPLVKFVAGRLGATLPSHVDEQDLVSYGLLGLIGAIERYDPGREIKFETYAIARIKGAIIDELRSLDWVRAPSARERGRSSARSSSWSAA